MRWQHASALPGHLLGFPALVVKIGLSYIYYCSQQQNTNTTGQATSIYVKNMVYNKFHPNAILYIQLRFNTVINH